MSFFKRKINNEWICYGNENIGKSHVEDGIPCQDKISYCCDKKKLIATLCDGLGSKKNADKGAAFVSYAIKQILSKDFFELFKLDETDIAKALVNELLALLHKNKEICKTDIDSLKTTLMFIAIRNGRFILGHIGDGVLCLLNNDEIVYYSSCKKNTQELEFANTTYTVFDDDVEKHFIIKKGFIDNSFNGALLISDGLPFLANSNKIAPKAISYLDLIRSSEYEFIDSEINNNIAHIVKSKDTCVDDWSYIFVVKSLYKRAKPFYNNK